MKLTFASIILIFLLALGAGCAKEDLTPGKKNDLDYMLLRTWKISLFTDGSVDQTELYAGVSLTCFENGDLTVDFEGHVYNGTWTWDENEPPACVINIRDCDEVAILRVLNCEWTFTGYTEFSCFFSNADPHTGCSENGEHERIMKWTEK